MLSKTGQLNQMKPVNQMEPVLSSTHGVLDKLQWQIRQSDNYYEKNRNFGKIGIATAVADTNFATVKRSVESVISQPLFVYWKQ